MSSIDELKNRARGIRDENRTGANTANRVGQLLYDMIGYVGDNEGDWEGGGGGGTTLRPPLSSINNIGYNPGGSNKILVYSGTGWTYTNLPTSNPDDSTSGKYIEQAFKATPERTTPQLPTGDLPNNGWNTYISNDNSTYYVWMCTRIVNNGVATSWQGPWCLTGNGGEVGADALDIEFIYYQTTSSDSDDLPNHLNRTGTIPSGSGRVEVTLTEAEYKTTDDFVPDDWNDTAGGVSENNPYEWMCIRTKIGGEWTPFGSPFIWSHWGKNGNDGDGVEYIFYATNGTSIVGTVNQYPQDWITDYPTAVGKNSKRYQDYDYVGPEGSAWEDNPFDLSTAGFGQGARQWVSMRKRDHETGLWGAFTPPALWNYYSQDGVADGYIFNLTKPNAICLTDVNGTVDTFTVTTGTELFYNGGRISSYTVSTGNPTINGTAVSSSNCSATVNSSDKSVTVTITNLANVLNKTLDLPITITFNTDQTKTLIFSILFYPPTQADSIDLCTNTTNIHFTHYRSQWSPTELEVWCLLSNNGEFTKIRPEDHNTQGYSFQYQYISGSQQGDVVALTSNSITDFFPDLYTSINVFLLKDGKNLLYRNIQYTYDGAPGIGVTQYSIQPISCSIKVSSAEGSQTIAGSLSFQVLKHIGNTTPEPMSIEDITSNTWNVAITANGRTIESSSINYNSTTKTFSFSLNETYNQYPYANIRLQSDNNTVLASTVVPFSVEGTKGDSWSQSFNGVVMRMLDWSEDRAGLNGEGYYNGQSPDSEGIYYLDVVHYPAFEGTNYSGGSYYRLKPDLLIDGQTGSIHPMDGNTIVPPTDSNGNVNDAYWIEFASPSDSAAFRAVIASYAFIQNLTGREIVITDGQGNPVAGLTSGESWKTDDSSDINDVTRGDIRIWAGSPTKDGVNNLANCPFYVTNTGVLYAENGEFGGTVNGVSGTFKQLYCEDENGNRGGGIEFYHSDYYNTYGMIFRGYIDHNGMFSSSHISANNIGTGRTNTIFIQESGSTSIKSTVTYIVGSTSCSLPNPNIITLSNGNKLYDIPLEGVYLTNYTADPDVKAILLNSYFDTVVIIGATGSGKISYDFRTTDLGKRLTVINSSSVEVYIATHNDDFLELPSYGACTMTHVPDGYYMSSRGYYGKGWFVTGNFRN